MARRETTSQGRRVLPWLLLVLWVAVIWGHSLVPAEGSDTESLFVVDVLCRFLGSVGPVARGTMNHLVRKTAHFTEYLILALLGMNALRPRLSRPYERVAPLVALWVLTPSIDEGIQRFVPGRAGMVADVLLDMSGFACGLLICAVLAARLRARRGSAA